MDDAVTDDDFPSYTEAAETSASVALRTIAFERPRERLLRRDIFAVVETGDLKGRRIPVGTRRVLLGASSSCDVVLTGDAGISRRHAEIIPSDLGPILVDLQSRNGSVVAGQRVTRAYLYPGSVVKLGSTHLSIVETTEESDVEHGGKDPIPGILGDSSEIVRVRGLVRRLAGVNATVLIDGESGTGKEGIARALHSLSPRAANPFVTIDCGALAKELVEAELFGYTKGAFTGAEEDRAGSFEQADGGTVFLDEIGEIPMPLQVKLLRVLESREVRRVGGAGGRTLDIRIVAATNRDLAEEVEAGRFREDLFHRLAVVRLQLPPLRERGRDIGILARAFLRDPEVVEDSPRELSSAAELRLTHHSWPGNIRELKNMLRAVVAMSSGRIIEAEELPAHLSPYNDLAEAARVVSELPFKEARTRMLEAFEADYLARVLRRTRGNISETARLTGIHRKTVERMVQKLGLDIALMRRPGRG